MSAKKCGTLGFIGPAATQLIQQAQARAAAPPITVPTASRPIVGWTTTSGFARRPIYAPTVSPGLIMPSRIPAVSRPSVLDAGPGVLQLPFYDELRRFKLTREQIRRLQEQAERRGEVTEAQYREDGDGAARELEQEAAEKNGIDKAIDDLKAGAVVTEKPAPVGTERNWLPLALLAAAAYFLA